MRCLVVALCALSIAPAHADDERAGAIVHARIGTVAAPFYTDALPELRSEFQAYALTVEAWYQRTPTWRGALRIPIATSSVEQPGGSYAADYTIGNPELSAERAFVWQPLVRHGAAARARFGIGAPLAGHDSSWIRNRVVAASDALDGWRNSELYWPGVIPVTAAVTAELARRRWRAAATAKLALAIRISDADLPAGADTRALGLLPSFELAAAWRPRAWLAIGAAGALVAVLRDPVAPMRDAGRSGRVQPTARPSIDLVGRRVSLGLDLVLALGGPLRGSAGLGLHLGWRH